MTHALHRNFALPLVAAVIAACSDQSPTAPELAPESASAARAHHAPVYHYAFTTIDVPDATLTNAQGVNARGDVVGLYTAAGATHGFLLHAGHFTTIDFPGAAITQAKGISPQGDVVGSYRMPGEPAVNAHGFLLSRRGYFHHADFPGHTNTIPQRILPDGTILGCRHDNDLMETMRGIVMGRGGASEIGAFASMNNGATPGLERIAGLYRNMAAGRIEGYAIDRGVFTPLVVPGSTTTAAWDVNPAGDVVGVYQNAAGFHGFVWAEGDDFRTVDFPGAAETRVFGINPRGDLVGFYVAGGVTHGFLASPIRQHD